MRGLNFHLRLRQPILVASVDKPLFQRVFKRVLNSFYPGFRLLLLCLRTPLVCIGCYLSLAKPLLEERSSP